MILYHGSDCVVEFPEIRKTKYAKDFSWGFYCTKNFEQAKRWSLKKGSRGYVNVYNFEPDKNLNVKIFSQISDEWLDFIAKCRSGYVHNYDIVEGPMADDTIWNYVNDYIEGDITKEAFFELAKFKYPTHQISFHSLRALDCLKFEGVEDDDQ